MEYWKEHINYRQERQTDGTVRYLIRIDNDDIEVDEELYQEYARMERRERYLKERDTGVCLSLDQFSEDELSGDYLLDCSEQNAEAVMLDQLDDVEQARLTRLLPLAIATLTESERQIISALYNEGIALRTYAREQGIPVMTLHYRVQRILQKLQKNLKLLSYTT